MRVVVDTNVLISAALSESRLPYAALAHVMRFCTPVCSRELIREYRHVMDRTVFDRHSSRSKRTALVNAFEEGADIAGISGTLAICRDPRDNIVIETALLGRADVLITGDSDILSLRPLHDVDIVTPREYIRKYAQ